MAAEAGATALILFMDPSDYGPPEGVKAFPETWWLPGSGLQRGTILISSSGDPLTPEYPSTGENLRISHY